MTNKVASKHVELARSYAKDFIKKQVSKNYLFHNTSHTEEVVEALELLIKEEGIKEDEKWILQVAGWFHDTGYINGNENHEENSIKIFDEYLEKNNLHINNADKEKIHSCIRSTKIPQRPKNIYEKIMCDADLSHLGKDNFWEKGKMLREEWGIVENKKFEDNDWLMIEYNFLKAHEYFCDSAKRIFDPIKKVHIEKLKSELVEKQLLRKSLSNDICSNNSVEQ